MDRETTLRRLRALDLPLGHYVVVGSGPLGVRGIREIADIDVQVDETLWSVLVDRFGSSPDGRTLSLGDWIDAHRDSAFTKQPGEPDIGELIAEADLIEGAAFASLQHTKALKRAKGRRKDLADIDLIEQYERTPGA